jgi:hypothetical protein
MPYVVISPFSSARIIITAEQASTLDLLVGATSFTLITSEILDIS